MQNFGPAFFYKDMIVGLFEEGVLPTSDGAYKYMPTRGPGHFRLGETLRTEPFALCYYKTDVDKIWFKITKSPSFGVVELSDFRREPCPPSPESDA